MAGSSGLTYGVDITTRTQLIDGLNSQRIFFDDESGLNELEPSEVPFLTILAKLAKKKASGNIESYIEHRGSYANAPQSYFVKEVDTTAIAAAAAGTDIDGLGVSLTAGGALIDPSPLNTGDVLVALNPNDPTQFAALLVTVLQTGATDDEVNCELLTASPGFDLVDEVTELQLLSRLFAEGSEESEARYEKPATAWNEIGSFKESFQITDQLEATTQIVYGNELLKQNAWAQMRLKRDVDRALLTASQRVNLATATNPFSARGAAAILDADGNELHMSMSFEQGVKAADVVGIGGSRLFKLTSASMTPDELDESIIEQFRYGSRNKVCVAGSGALAALIAMSRKHTQYNLVAGDNKFGLTWQDYVTPYATLPITINRGFTGRLNNAMFIMDTQYLQLRQLIPMYTEKLLKNSTTKKWEVRWDLGLRMKFPEAHGLWFFV